MMNNKNKIDLADRFRGILVGTAVGDSLGLPYEGLSKRRAKKMFKKSHPFNHSFIFGRGMISDDTEHAFFVAQSLLKHDQNADGFAKSLAWKLRLWFALLPAGIGMATLKSCLKLWLGFSPKKSGVFSAGNGPAMRAAIIGGYFYDDPAKTEEMGKISTRITHTDPKAEIGALAIARIAAWAVCHEQKSSSDVYAEIMALMRSIPNADKEWEYLLEKIDRAFEKNMSVLDFAKSLGLEKGITGYMYDTIPVVIYAFIANRERDFGSYLLSVIECGGDTDTTGAIIAALAGAYLGESRIWDSNWKDRIIEWPRSLKVIAEAGTRLAFKKQENRNIGPVGYFWPALPLRNLFFMIVVLLHGFRRLLPPY